MKNLLATVFITASCLFTYAQKPPIKFGEIPMEDMTMTTYSLDSSASAVVLADYGEAYVTVSTQSATLMFERHVRIKILKKEGLSWADASIALYKPGSSSEERVTSLKASTFNLENGKIVETKMSKDGVFNEKFNRYTTLQKFTFPNVKEGSVIEYSYKINSPFISNFPNWQFQRSIPTRYTEYWAVIPDFFTMEKYMQGYITPTSYEVKNIQRTDYIDKGHHWIIKNVPAFKEEPFMTSENDYLSKINFALAYINFPGQPTQEVMGSWQKLNNGLLISEAFGKIITGNGFLSKQVEEIVAGETDPMKKIEKIYNHVKRTVEWDGYRDFLGDKPKEVLEKKKGTSGDINLLLASMLEKAGIVVDMVLISTRDHGFIRQQYPMDRQFNYVVCMARVNDKQILLDATEPYLPMGVLPERCLNGQGLVISGNAHGWLPLETKTKARTVVNVDLTLNESSELAGNISFSRDGYDAIDMRKTYHAKGESDYMSSAFGKKASWQIDKTSFENLKEIDKSVKEIHELTINDHVTTAGDMIYINPFVVEQLAQNPFTLEDRIYPVDYGSLKEKVYMCKLTLPEGYTIDELPQGKVYIMPGGTAKYTYSITQLGNQVNIISNFQINRNIFLQAEYKNLREFYNQVVAKQAEQIVLKKK